MAAIIVDRYPRHPGRLRRVDVSTAADLDIQYPCQ